MLITLFTDASWCQQTRIGAWAVWFKANGEAHREAGIFKAPRPAGSLAAEARAIVVGLHLIATRLDPPAGSKVIVQTDCSVAAAILQGQVKRARTTARHSEERARYLDVTAGAPFEIEIRHVKAHKGDATPRSAVNSWCDRTCRRLLREARRASKEAA